MLLRRIGALAGILGSVGFVLTFLIEGWLRPGYDPSRMFVSELALGPRGWIQTVNFSFIGAMMFVFAAGAVSAFRTGIASRAGPAMLAVMALGLGLSAVFPIDPPGRSADDMTSSGKLHYLFGSLFFTLAPIACLLFALRFKVEEAYRGLWAWSVLAGLLTIAAIASLYAGASQSSDQPSYLSACGGAIQRVFIIVYMTWQTAFAVVMLRNGPNP